MLVVTSGSLGVGVEKSTVEAGEVVSLDAIPGVGHETVGDGIKGDGSWMSISLWIPNWAPLKPEEALKLRVGLHLEILAGLSKCPVHKPLV